MLSGMRWKRLIEYIGKTDATIQMPTVVWEEIKRNYTKVVNGLFANASSAIEKLNHHLNFRAPHFSYWGARLELSGQPKALSVADVVERYLSFVKETLQLKGKDFVRWDRSWFEEIIDRAINRVKPFGDESDKGFKDTLLWKTILSLANRPGFKDGPVILISSNSKDFGDPQEKGKIHPALQREARDLGLNLHYFDSLDAFLEKWAYDAMAVNASLMKQVFSDAMLKTALGKFVRPLLRKNEAIECNIFFSGINYKFESEVPGRVAVRASVSGYVTNTLTPHEYLDFSAEAIYKEDRETEKVSIENFVVPARREYPNPVWPEEDFCSK